MSDLTTILNVATSAVLIVVGAAATYFLFVKPVISALRVWNDLAAVYGLDEWPPIAVRIGRWNFGFRRIFTGSRLWTRMARGRMKGVTLGATPDGMIVSTPMRKQLLEIPWSQIETRPLGRRLVALTVSSHPDVELWIQAKAGTRLAPYSTGRWMVDMLPDNDAPSGPPPPPPPPPTPPPPTPRQPPPPIID